MANELDTRINAMLPGESIELSRTNEAACHAERSGDGSTLRFVRTKADGSIVVFRSVRFAIV